MSQLWKKSATEITQLVRSREVSAVEVTEDSLARLGEVNPAINAVVKEFPDEAIAAAREVDRKLANGEEPGALCGVPVTVKVNIDQVGHATTNGLQLQKDLIATIDNPVVSNLRKAGAVIVGRTNTPAFSIRWFTRSTLHGHTLNPRSSSITPGGSSGGAASATAAGIGAIGHGTDIAGSVRYPAYACGIHGLRPTTGRIPSMNFSGADRHVGGQLMAVSGPLARTIEDVRLGFEAMSAEDLRDPWWTPVPLRLPVKRKRVALTIAPEGMQVATEVETALRDAAKRLQDAGWEVEEVDCPPLREPAQLQLTLWLAEFRRIGTEVIAKEGDSDASFVFEQIEKHCPESTLPMLLDAIQKRATLLREWQLFLDDYPVWLNPVSGELPFKDLEDVASEAAFARIVEAQLTQIGLPLMGLPGLTVSTGMVGHIPVGVQLVGGRYQENVLLEAAAAIEQGGCPPSPIDPVA